MDKGKRPNQTMGNLNIPQSFLEKVYIWASFHRQYPFMYVEQAMNIKLKIFQKILIYIMFHYNFTAFLASRGLGSKNS